MNLEVEAVEAGGAWVRRSALYREFAAERAEVLKHKWLESEQAGRDIGIERALVSWVIHHRAQWQRERRAGRELDR